MGCLGRHHVLGASVAHWRWDRVDRGSGILLASHPAHLSSVSHEFSLILFKLGIFNKTLVLASTSLFDAAESEDGETDAYHATN
jgi:hypothetical protein